MEWIGKLLSVHTGDTWYVGKEFFDMKVLSTMKIDKGGGGTDPGEWSGDA